MPKGASQPLICAAITPSRSTWAISTAEARSEATEPPSEIQRPAGDIRHR